MHFIYKTFPELYLLVNPEISNFLTYLSLLLLELTWIDKEKITLIKFMFYK